MYRCTDQWGFGVVRLRQPARNQVLCLGHVVPADALRVAVHDLGHHEYSCPFTSSAPCRMLCFRRASGNGALVKSSRLTPATTLDFILLQDLPRFMYHHSTRYISNLTHSGHTVELGEVAVWEECGLQAHGCWEFGRMDWVLSSSDGVWCLR